MSWNDTALAMESLAMLAAARFLVKTGRSESLVSRMGGSVIRETELTSESPDEPAPPGGSAERVGVMIERVARITWWRSMCLEKALAGKWMLRRRGISGTMYVGMARQGGDFVAHAWLVAEGRTVTGAGKTVYATLAAFREPEKSAARGGDLKGV